MKKIQFICLSLLLALAGPVAAQQAGKQKKIVIGVVWVPALHSEVFAVNEARYNTIGSLKKYLVKQSEGTVVVWDPGCVRIGDKPLLSSATELSEFRKFVEKRRMKFIEIPSA
jgi:hypothetical protein